MEGQVTQGGQKDNDPFQTILNRLESMNETLLQVQKDVKKCTECQTSTLPRLNALETDMKNVKSEVNSLKEKNLQLESYIRRDNLIFGGISESEPEDCENKVKFVLTTVLQMNASEIKFQRVHRIGKKVPGKSRPIIARFLWFPDRQNVWRKRGELKEKMYWISEDYPTEIRERRNILRPILKKAIDLKTFPTIYMVGDRLYANNQVFTVDTLDRLPAELRPETIATPVIDEDYVAFFNRNSPLSNFYPAKFMLENKEFQHVEQYFQFKKAEMCGKPQVANSILLETCPLKCKLLGKQAQANPEWRQKQEDVMLEGCNAKFQQNLRLMDFLNGTGERTIVEARTDDKFWGAGIAAKDTKLVNPTSWPGKNKLGYILMKIRDNEV